MSLDAVNARLADIDTTALNDDLEAQGWSVLPDVLTSPQCDDDVALYAVRGTRGDYRVKLRHGVSEIIEGHRHTLGIIFHDAT